VADELTTRLRAAPDDSDVYDVEPTSPRYCHLPVQEGKWCGLVICRRNGCRLAETYGIKP
jgi:hypothetical protein